MPAYYLLIAMAHTTPAQPDVYQPNGGVVAYRFNVIAHDEFRRMVL
jgi:hypothetical protein